MLQKSTLEFLKALKKNNNRDWFGKNRAKYESALEDFTVFVNKLIAELSKQDASLKGVTAKESIFRIYRDVRFSKNKDPYKTNFGAVVCQGGRKSDRACFYIQVEPGNSFIAGGRWMPSTEHLKDIRKDIFYHLKDFKKILSDKSFKKFFKELSGEKLKLAPKGFDKDFSDIELLKYTSYIVDTPVNDKLLTGKSLIKQCAVVHKAMLPLLNFLNKATN
ncbi:MAG TPA: DUF2461 domain-containing protein [Bacteroidia bacterium]|nr:DUF2461 domain-containing protein [Bacteroidia bacterium]